MNLGAVPKVFTNVPDVCNLLTLNHGDELGEVAGPDPFSWKTLREEHEFPWRRNPACNNFLCIVNVSHQPWITKLTSCIQSIHRINTLVSYHFCDSAYHFTGTIKLTCLLCPWTRACSCQAGCGDCWAEFCGLGMAFKASTSVAQLQSCTCHPCFSVLPQWSPQPPGTLLIPQGTTCPCLFFFFFSFCHDAVMQ